MFKFLRHINIATQLMFLVVLVVGLAILVVSWVAETDTRSMLRFRSEGSLADESYLRAHALRDALRTLGARVRELALNVPVEPDGTVKDASLRAALTRPSRLPERCDDGVLREIAVVRVGRGGQVRNLAVLRRGPQQRFVTLAHPKANQPGSPAANEVWARLVLDSQEPDRQPGGRQFVSRLHRAPPETPANGDAAAYQTAISFGLTERGAEEPAHLIVTIDFTELIRRQATLLPRNLLFVRARDGSWAYHPDPARIGSREELWALDEIPSGEERSHPGELAEQGVQLPTIPLPGLRFYTVRVRLTREMTETLEARRSLEGSLRDKPGLRFSPIYQGAGSLVLSADRLETLESAREALTTRETASRAQPGEWPRPIECRTFTGYYLPEVALDLNGSDQVGLVLASAEEELVAEAQASIWLMRWQWFLPILGVSALLALVAGHLLTRPLSRLTDAAQRLAAGDHGFEVHVRAPGEVGELARAFKNMASQTRQREIELRESLMLMRTILNNAADGIITFDQTGRIEQANASAEEMFGAGPGGLLQTKVQDLLKLPERVRQMSSDSAMSLGASGTSSMRGRGGMTEFINAVKLPGEEHRGIKRDGSTFWMEVTFSQVPLEDRRIITGIFRDITQRKVAEERIRQINDELDARVKLRTAQLEDARAKLEVTLGQAQTANAAKDSILKTVNHELRTPLTAVKGFTDYLVKVFNGPANPRTQAIRDNPLTLFHKILTCCEHLMTLINDLLDIGSYTAGKPFAINPERFDLTAFLRGVLEMAAPLSRKNGNQLVAQIPEGLGEGYNDETRLRQVLLNLISNACKFTEKGTVTLEVERRPGTPPANVPPDGGAGVRTGDVLVFRVKDTGEGMSPAQMTELFKPFYRIDNSMSRRHGGTGLGLTITKMICELMGGGINVESAPGRGSTFTVTLPAEYLPVAAREKAEPGAQPGEKPRTENNAVLVIDDDPSIREMLETYLQQEGFTVVLAGSGEEGVRKARELRPVCITLDVIMPDQDGWGVLAMLKNDPATRDIPVIMLTILEEKDRGFTLGATEYLTKPIDWGRLGEILCRYHRPSAPILIVDDDGLQRAYLRDVLTQSNWSTVLEASNGEEALRICEQTPPSLVLLDLMMPIMDGFQFLEELRRRPKGMSIPVVVLTAMQLSAEDRRRLNRSVAQVIAKESLSKERLLERIREQMQGLERPANA